MGQDKNDPGGRLEHYQTLHVRPALRGETTPASLCPWAPFLKRGSSLAGKYNVEGWSGGLGSVWGKRFEEKHMPAMKLKDSYSLEGKL